MEITNLLALGERQKPRVKLLLQSRQAHRCCGHAAHRDGPGAVVDTAAVGVSAGGAGLLDAPVPVLGRALVHTGLPGSCPTRDALGPKPLVLVPPGMPARQAFRTPSGLPGPAESGAPVHPQLTRHHGHVPHDTQPCKETLPQPRKIIASNDHGPRNSHRSRVLRGPLEPKLVLTDQPRPRPGFWCECWSQDLTDTEAAPPRLQASFDAYSAPQADRWVAIALRTISPTLDADASEEAWEWLFEGRIHTRRTLLRGEPCTVTVTHADTRITWTIRPVLFLPLAHRSTAELPTCAYDFKSRWPD